MVGLFSCVSPFTPREVYARTSAAPHGIKRCSAKCDRDVDITKIFLGETAVLLPFDTPTANRLAKLSGRHGNNALHVATTHPPTDFAASRYLVSRARICDRVGRKAATSSYEHVRIWGQSRVRSRLLYLSDCQAWRGGVGRVWCTRARGCG